MNQTLHFHCVIATLVTILCIYFYDQKYFKQHFIRKFIFRISKLKELKLPVKSDYLLRKLSLVHTAKGSKWLALFELTNHNAWLRNLILKFILRLVNSNSANQWVQNHVAKAIELIRSVLCIYTGWLWSDYATL